MRVFGRHVSCQGKTGRADGPLDYSQIAGLIKRHGIDLTAKALIITSSPPRMVYLGML